MKTKILFLFLLVTSLISCSSDDDNNEQMDNYKQELIGQWKLVSYVMSINQYAWNKETPVNGNLYLNLNSDGSCSITGTATYDMRTEEGAYLSTGKIYLSDYDVKTWTFGSSATHDAFIALHYYNTYSKMNDYVGFGVDFDSKNRIKLYQKAMEDNYYIFEKVK